jgi:hypothetical protein
MNIIRKILIPLIILMPFFLFECDDDTVMNCESAICTEEYRSIVVSLKHESNGAAFQLTDYSVIRVSDNRNITIADNDLTDNHGYYLIANDSGLNIFKNKNIEVEFRGYLNNSLVIKQRLIITADCCHVSLAGGNTDLFI